jgi:inner membrane protein
MDNLTHSLVGLAASKAGLERLSPQATAVCILASNAPDSDILALLVGGRWSFLQHHRGITHSIIGTLVLALLIPLIFYLADRLVARIRSRRPSIKLRGLMLATLIVSATHPFMDWTNNYGIRLLLPWNSRWFYGDLVFIVDPFLWLIFGAAAFLLTSKTRKQILIWLVLALLVTYVVFFGPAARGGLMSPSLLRGLWVTALIGIVILSRLNVAQRWGGKLAIAAFAVVVLYWGGLAIVHTMAIRQAQLEASVIASEDGEKVDQIVAMPTLANPFHWQCVVETERAAYRFELFLIGGRRGPSGLIRYPKPDPSASHAVAVASGDARARIFLGFARFPVVRVVTSNCTTQTLVQFADLRYTEPGRGAGTFSLEVPIESPHQSAARDQ